MVSLVIRGDRYSGKLNREWFGLTYCKEVCDQIRGAAETVAHKFGIWSTLHGAASLNSRNSGSDELIAAIIGPLYYCKPVFNF